jgi:hypothetical protein
MRRTLETVGLGAVLLGACVLGWRGEAAIEGVHDLAGITTVRIDLPSTPLSVVACDLDALTACPEQLRYRGRFLSTGGSANDAEDHAQQAALIFERNDGLGSLTAELPLAVRGLVELELDAIELPSDRDLELVTDRGDIDVFGVRGAITVEVRDVGDVHIDGGDAGVAARVDDGLVEVRSAGDVELVAGEGAVRMVQTGAARRVHIEAGHGMVTLELASSSDVDLDVHADGEIRVSTDGIVALTHDRLRRRVGTGAVEVSIRAGGRVEITQRQ